MQTNSINILKQRLEERRQQIADSERYSDPNFFEDRRECFNNNKDIISFKRLAPSAHSLGEPSKVLVFPTSSSSTNAVAAPLACDQFANGSHTNVVADLQSNDEELIPENLDAGSAEEADGADVASAFDPNFYYLRHDLFDNGKSRNKTRYRSKITTRFEPTDKQSDSMVMLVEFHNRPRDFKAFLKKHSLWEHPWYQNFWERFEGVRSAAHEEMAIAPTLGIIKERVVEHQQITYQPVAFAACALWQEPGEAPEIYTQYGAWHKFMSLSGSFNTTKQSNLSHVGYYRDPERQQIEDALRNKPGHGLIFKKSRR